MKTFKREGWYILRGNIGGGGCEEPSVGIRYDTAHHEKVICRGK